MTRTYVLLSILVILHSRINTTKAACSWNDIDGCKLYCTREYPEDMIVKLVNLMNSQVREDCNNNGILLNIQPLYYHQTRTIESRWFTANVKVIQLDINFSDATRGDLINNVSVDAFLSDAFRTVKILNIRYFGLEVARNGMFNGLDILEILNIEAAYEVGHIEDGILDSVNELKELRLIQLSKYNDPISIKGFTGCGELAKLENVQFKYKLTTIAALTFVGLTNVKILDLSGCQIESIDPNAFNPIVNSIERIILTENLLTTIPAGLFMLPINGLIIDITDNKFDCTCELMPLRLALEQFEVNFNDSGSIKCETSPIAECMPSNVKESDCFNDCDRPPTTPPTSTSTPPTNSSTTTTTLDPDEYFTKECYEPNESQFSDVVSVKQPSTYMTMTETASGDVYLNIDSECSSLVVIWFNENQESVEDISCISQDGSTSIPVTDLVNDVIYSVCLMDKTKSNVSPLDCISYVKRGGQRDSVWLLQSSRTLAVTLIVISLVFSVIFGVGIGFWILNYNPLSKSGRTKTSDVPTMSKAMSGTNSIRNSNTFNRKTSDITNNSDNAMICNRITLQYGTSIPPLPERPQNLRLCEPAYATIEEIYNDK